MDSNDAIQIDLDKVLKEKLGGKRWLVPSFVVKWLQRTIHQDIMNEKLRKLHPKRGAEFCDAVITDLNISVDFVHEDRLPGISDRRVIFVCNHPLGGLDGIALISLLSKHYGSGVKFVVNDILMALEPLRDVFIPINKHGQQNKESVAALNAAMAGDEPIFIFPAGLVSRRQKDGEIRDLTWNKMFVSKALQYKRDIIPIYFSGQNTKSFYNLAYWRKRLAVPFNIEMIYLPDEMLRSQDKHFQAVIGERIPYSVLAKDKPKDVAQAVKELTYRLSSQLNSK